MALNSYQQIEVSMVFGFKLNALLLYYANNISRQYLNIFRKMCELCSRTFLNSAQKKLSIARCVQMQLLLIIRELSLKKKNKIKKSTENMKIKNIKMI